MTEFRVHTRVSDNPLSDEEVEELINNLQPLIVDIVVNGLKKKKQQEMEEKLNSQPAS